MYNTKGLPKIKETKCWTGNRVRSACIENNLYICGTYDEYDRMLKTVDSIKPTTRNLYKIASDICEHSKGQTVSNIMFILSNEAVITAYDIEGEEL